MNSKYKIVFVISILLVILSFSITAVNYAVSLNNTEKQLKNQSLPLSLDNIYTVIQKYIIEPYLVSSMMANDTFVHSWLLADESNHRKIEKYLDVIKHKYGMYTAFLVSEKTKNYYTQDGFVETIDKKNERSKWYFDFKNIQNKHEINLDFNENLSNSLMMFINYKIFDEKYNFIGATGVGLKISYINDILETFRVKHHFKVFFVNKKGEIVLSEKEIIPQKTIDEMQSLKKFKKQLISKEPSSLEYKKDGDTYLVNTKYVPELDLYLLVEAKLQDFTKDVRQIFYINIFVCLLISLVVVLITVYLIRNYSKKLEYLAGNDQLTGLNNRRIFEEKLSHQMKLQQRNQKDITLTFMDVDSFKKINDSFGHEVGDKVLARVAAILKENIRKSDLISRWGGEEFLLAFIGSDKTSAFETTEKLKFLIENDYVLKNLVGEKVTGSFGISQFRENDTMDKLISRADNAMYKAKENGKNCIIISEE